MRMNSTAPNRAPEQHSPVPAPNSKACYLSPAPIMDILLEQLEYLVDHANHICPAGCSDCARLSQVEHWLLLPFRSPA